MKCLPQPPTKVEVKLLLHPRDHLRALAIAKAANINERDFFALALHLGATQLQQEAAAR